VTVVAYAVCPVIEDSIIIVVKKAETSTKYVFLNDVTPLVANITK
jgi:hypothetical protein